MNIITTWQIIIGILVPFLGTSLGAALVFLLKKEIKPIVQKILLGFASGVMIAASVWSLLIPAIEMAEQQNKIAWIPASVGFILGTVILIVVNNVAERLENKIKIERMFNRKKLGTPEKEVSKEKLKSTSMLVLAVTLHNIPEGMAVGVAFAGLLTCSIGVTLAGAFALAIGIAIQNIPEIGRAHV